MTPHLLSRVTVLGTGLIGGSFALALRKYITAMHISGWDRPDVVREAQTRGALDESFSGDLAPALRNSALIYSALPIAATIDLLPEIARHAPTHALVPYGCRPRGIPLRPPRRKRPSHPPCWSGPPRFAPSRRQSLFHLARYRPHQPGSSLRGARSLRPPPRRYP